MRHRVLSSLTFVLVLSQLACVRSGPEAARGEEAPEGRAASAASADEYREERRRMIERQMVAPPDGRPAIESPSVIAAMRAVPRHAFVPEEFAHLAYEDRPLPIGEGQTISQPYIVALVTEKLALDAGSKVLEVGAGSGYQTAVLAEITPNVFGIEIVHPLYERARRTLEEQGYSNVRLRHGDGYFGWKEEAPFDGIIVSCAAESIPEPLWEQLRAGGRIVIPVGDPGSIQDLVVVHKKPDGSRRVEHVAGVSFVPLTGEGARRRGESAVSRP